MRRVQLSDGQYCLYRIQESERSGRVRLRLSAAEGMVVIVPRGVLPDLEELERLIRDKSRWIIRHLTRFGERQRKEPARPDPILPRSLHLRAVGEHWSVTYAEQFRHQAPGAARARTIDPGLVQVSGKIDRPADVTTALRTWLRQRAAETLAPWLEQLALETRMPYARVTIRNQRSRWGSCTGKKHISLNCKLLFLPRPWTRYVLIHELCHTQILNHGPDFWTLLTQYEPHASRIRREMRLAWQTLPPWLTMD